MEEHHPEGDYYLRYRVGNTRTFEPVGQDIGLLLATQKRREVAQWDICIQYVNRKAPHLLADFQKLKYHLQSVCIQIEEIRITPETNVQKRNNVLGEFNALKETLHRLIAGIQA